MGSAQRAENKVVMFDLSGLINYILKLDIDVDHIVFPVIKSPFGTY